MRIFRYIIIINNNDRARAESEYTYVRPGINARDGYAANKICGRIKDREKKNRKAKTTGIKVVKRGGADGQENIKYKNAFRQRLHFAYVRAYLYYYYNTGVDFFYIILHARACLQTSIYT